MTQPAKSQEPSMEEILASIRRIIADDDAKPTPAAGGPPPVAPPPRQAAPPPAPPPPPPRAEPSSIKREGALRQEDVDLMLKSDTGATRPQAAEPPADVLNLTEAMITTPPPPPMASDFQTIDGEPDVVFKEPEPALPPPPPPKISAPELSRELPQRPPEQPLISTATSAAIDSAFNTLAHTVLVQNARTLEDLVREMLRPMLKTWLDDNLPGIVERLVRAEIERVSRGRS